MKIALSLCSMLAMAATLPAQGPKSTIPTGYLTSEAPYYQWGAYRYSKGRHQNLFSPNSAGTATAGTVLINLYLRPDGGTTTSGKAAFVREWEVVMSSNGINYMKPVKTAFAANHGKDMKVFMKRKKFNLAAVPANAPTPHKWAADLKGDAPFAILKGNGVCIDVKSYSATYSFTGWYTDATRDLANDTGSYSALGAGCPTNFYMYGGYYYVGATQPFYTYGYTRALGDLAIAFVGAKKVAIKMGGACTLYTLPLLVHPKVVKTTSTSGYTGATANRHQWGKVPASMGGKNAIAQMAAITAKGALKLSRAMDITFGKGPVKQRGMKVLYDYGSSFDPDKSPPRFGPYDYGVIFGRN